MPECTGGRILNNCYDGCPREGPCGSDLGTECDPLFSCETRCVCPEGKPFWREEDGACVSEAECNGIGKLQVTVTNMYG